MVKAIWILLGILPLAINAQGSLSAGEMKDYKDEAIRKVKSFLSYVDRISNGSPQTEDYKRLGIQLFKSGALIEVANIREGKTVTTYYPPEKYFNALSRYKDRFIRSVTHFESLRISTLKPTLDPKTKQIYYVGTASFVMSFCADKNAEIEGWEICDYTEKDIEIVLKKIETLAGTYWKLLLGDITVQQIRNL